MASEADCPDNRPCDTPSFCLRALHVRMTPSSAPPARLDRTAHHLSLECLSLDEAYIRYTHENLFFSGL